MQDDADNQNQKVMIIGDNNVFEVGCCQFFINFFKLIFEID